MHDQLCTAYAIQDKDSVWPGKLPVVAFSDASAFEECEKTFFGSFHRRRDVPRACDKMSDGQVIVTCHCGKDPNYFACVLVHETTHGFNHRYLSAVQLPSWLDEGIAEWTAMNVVHKHEGVVGKVQTALTRAKMQGNLGGDFFSDKNIQPWQYGISTSMVNFLIRSSGKKFRKMLDAIKLGTSGKTPSRTPTTPLPPI